MVHRVDEGDPHLIERIHHVMIGPLHGVIDQSLWPGGALEIEPRAHCRFMAIPAVLGVDQEASVEFFQELGFFPGPGPAHGGDHHVSDLKGTARLTVEMDFHFGVRAFGQVRVGRSPGKRISHAAGLIGGKVDVQVFSVRQDLASTPRMGHAVFKHQEMKVFGIYWLASTVFFIEGQAFGLKRYLLDFGFSRILG